MSREWIFWGEVTSVHDGDSFHVNCDLGLGIWLLDRTGRRIMVRLVNASAPELPTNEGFAAKDHLEELIPPGTLIKIISKKLDQYGRILAYVRKNEADVGVSMVVDGFATPIDATKSHYGG